MMLVVPLSSCITDSDELSHGSTGILGVEFPKEPETPVTPGNYKIVYHGNNEEITKSYNGTFAYAARLPDGWSQDGKVFAGWSKTNPINSPPTINEEVSSPVVDYQVYDDIVYDEEGIPKGADIESNTAVLNLYAVWVDETITYQEGNLQNVKAGTYYHTVYLGADGNDSNNGITLSTPVGTFKKAYSLLDPKGTTTTNRIIIVDKYTPTADNANGATEHGTRLWDTVNNTPATISGLDENSSLNVGKNLSQNSFLMLKAATIFENISITKGCVQIFIYCCGNDLTMGEGIDTSSIVPLPTGHNDNISYAIPEYYPAITILGGGYAKGGYDHEQDFKCTAPTLIDSMKPGNSKDFIIKLLSGVYGRVSGFGRSYESLGDRIETLCPTIIVSDDARVGTLAGGHLDSNATTGIDSNYKFKTAKIIIRTNELQIKYNKIHETSSAAVYLVGGNIGNSSSDRSSKSTFIGNVHISIYSGIIDNVYGAGLGRVKAAPIDSPQTSMSGSVHIDMCGGAVINDFYGGGAAAALSSTYAAEVYKDVSDYSSHPITSSISINIFGGTLKKDLFGGGYGDSQFIKNKSDYIRFENDIVQTGTVDGDISISVLNNSIVKNIFGGGSGVKHTDNSAEVIGNITILAYGTSISGNIYGGGKGVDEKQYIAKLTGNTNVYVKGLISGNVYGGGSIAVVSGSTNVAISGGTIGGTTDGGRVFGGGEGNLTYDWAGQVTGNTNVAISNGTVKGSVYGGGNFGAVGTSGDTSSSTTIVISGNAEIAGSVYGGGRGNEIDINSLIDINASIIQNETIRGNVYGNAEVIISGGKIGYLNNNWYDHEDSGSVYGGGKLGIVTGYTAVNISGGEIHKSVFGGGKGKYTLSPIDAILGAVGASSNVTISSSDVIISGSVYGGGELGIVGTYSKTGGTDQQPEYTLAGGKTSVNISNGVINGSVYGGGEGDPKNIVSGATGSTSTVISGNTEVKGSVYGGGAYGLVGDSVTATLIDENNHPITASDNKSSATVVILGGNIGKDVFGGGYGPNATVGGNTYVYLGISSDSNYPDNLINISQTDISVNGSVYGGGEMGSVGFVDLTSNDNGNSYHFGEDYLSKIETMDISSNVFITGNGSNNINIGNDKDPFENTNERIGNVYAGGKGGNLPVDSKTYKGFAIVHGSSNLTITGKQGNSIHIYGDVFGGGQGVETVKQPGNTEAILYAAVTKSSKISIHDVNIYHNVYGGGELSIVGWYYDDNELDSVINVNKDYRHFHGASAEVIISDSIINKNVYGGGTGTPANALSGAVGKTTVILSNSLVNLETKINGNIYGGGAYSIVGNFTVDRTPGEDGTVAPKIVSSTNDSESNVIILGGTIGSKSDSGSGNIFGGGYGPKAVIAGSTHVYLGKSAEMTNGMSNELKTLINGITQTDITINGNVYGGGEMGAVGFEYYEGETIAHSIDGISSNVVITSNSKSITINGSVYGGGKGWDLEIIKEGNNVTGTNEIKPGKDIQPGATVLHGYAIVHGNAVVNISGSGITIDKCVYGGGEGVLLDGAIITTSGDNYGKIDYAKVLGSLPYGQVTGNNDAGASVTITGAKVHENVYGGGNTGLIGIYTKTPANDNASKAFTIVYTGKPVSVTIENATIGVTDVSGHTSQDGGDDLTTGNVFGAGKGNDEGILLGAVGSSKVTIINSHIVKVTSVAEGESLEKAKALSGHVYGGGDYGIVGNFVTVKVDLNYNHDTGRYNPFEAHKVINYTTTKDIITVLISGTSEIDGNVYGGGKGTFDSHNSDGGVIIDPLNPNEGLIEPTMSAGYGTVYGSVKVTMSGGTVSGNVYGGGKGSLNDSNNGSILNSIPYGQITGLDPLKMSPPVTNEQTSTPSIAASVFISGGTVKGSVFGGGQLGILGTFNKASGYFSGKDTLVVIFSDTAVTVECSVFGGGEGSSSSAVSGIVNNTTVIIGKGAVIGKDVAIGENNYTKEVIGETTLRLYYGNVYGGGKLSIVGNVTVDENNVARVKASAEGTLDNTARTDVIILGGEIKRNVYGGGFSPKASIAGSTHVWIGKYTSLGVAGSPNVGDSLVHVGSDKSETDLKHVITVKGSVFGGGEMGAVGSSVIDLDSITDKSELVSANVSIKSDLNSITIGSKDANGNLINGNIFGGGEGVQNYADSPTQGGRPDIEVSGIKGYAIVRGSAYVDIEGNPADISNLTINGSVYGGGKGVQYNVESIHYAEVYDSAAVKVSNADIKGNVYGGGKMSIVGHFYDAYPVDGTQISWYNTNGTKTATYHVKIDGGKAYLVDGSGSYITVENGNIVQTTDLDKRLLVTYRYFCSDSAIGSEGTTQTTTNIPQYQGKGTAAVLITDSKVAGNVFGGGEGVDTNILAGAVGRGTVVTIDDSSGNNSKTEISGNVYGGGKLGIVGSIMTQVIGTGGIGTDTFSTTKVSHIVHSKTGMTNLEENPNLDSANDVDLVVNILGGHIKGSVFGVGKGEQVYYEGVNYSEDRISYYKLSVFGRTEVNISNGRIDKHVYGGSENGETGSLTVLKKVKEFADGYWDSNPYGDNRRGAPSDIPKDVRDNGYENNGTLVKPNLPSFSAAFVNIVGGTVYGNVFGGGYFGAVHGNTHVHIGWNAMMPDENTKGDCHYYNDYGDTAYQKQGHLPFVERSEEIINLGDVNLDENNNPKSLTKESTVHNLFLNGTVFAGGDRGDPSANTINYDYISVYGTSHIFLNGAGYVTGTDANEINAENGTVAKHAMYVQGSLFGSGNSCTTFYSDKANSRFITIKNYNAINDDKLNNFIIYSIQRATEVTLINSSLRLPGRSDGSNVNTSALYSLNHANALILRGGSTLVLDTEVNDLREFRSVDGTGANTTLKNPVNTLQLNNGIILIIAQVEGELNTAVPPEEEVLNRNESSDVSEAANFASLKKFIFGPVNGYSFVNLDSSSPEYYGGYIYGQYLSSGGFSYGSSFDTSVQGTSVNVVHYEATDDNLGYDVWKPTNGVVSSPTTLIADENKTIGNNPPADGFYEASGSVTLPMTVAGSIYELRGYNIIPSHAASISGDDRSLRLMSVKDGKLVPYDKENADTDFGLLMSLNEDTFTGSVEGGISSIWIDPTVDMFGQTTSAGAVGGNVLPQLDFTLYFKEGISKTGIAGEVAIYLQERLPVRDSTGSIIDYTYGDQIKVVLTIQTQNVANPSEVGDMDIYPHSIDGTSSWYFVIPPIDDEQTSYEFTLNSVNVSKGSISLQGKDGPLNSNSDYQLIMSAADNPDRSHGWSGYSLQNWYLTADNHNEVQPYVGTTDGRFGATLQFMLINKTGESDYEEGIITITFDLVIIRSDGTREDSQPLTLNINIRNKIPNYTVDFITGNGASYVPSQIVDSGSTAKRPADPSMIVAAPETQNLALGDKVILGEDVSHLEFLGWYADENYTILFDFKKSVTGNTKVYALFGCKVTFDSDGGSGVPPKDVIQGQTVDEPVDPTKKGYTFAGWYLNGNKYDFNSPVTSNITLKAEWETANVYIEYNMNGSSDLLAPTDSTVYQLTDNSNITLSSEYNTSTETTINGIKYKFAGWALTSSNPGKIYSSDMPVNLSEVIDSAMQYGKDYRITFYAVWILNEEHLITITADPEGSAGFTYSVEDKDGTRSSGEYTGPFSVKSESIVTITYKANNGYIHTTDQTSTGTITLSNVTGDQNITVKFTPKEFSVTLDPNGGTLENDPVKIQVTPGGNYSSLNGHTPTRDHHNFLGWFTEREGGTEVTAGTEVIPEVTTIYAHWELVTYTVTFRDDVANISGVYSNIPHGSTINLPIEGDPFVREGFELKGWTLGSTAGTVYKPGASYGQVTSNLIFYAKWGEASSTTHTVTFDPNSGTIIGGNTVTVKHGASIGENNMPADPTRAGYEFLGWFTAQGDSTEFTSADRITNDITVYAHWGKVYKITFDSNGGSSVPSIEEEAGTNIIKPADPTKQGYIFAGWYEDNETFQNRFIFNTMPSKDITLYAKWVEEDDPDYNFKVEYNANGGEGEVPKTEFHYAGSTVTVKPADLKNNECYFLGWQSSADGKLYQPGDQFRMPFKDVCLTAVWSSSPIGDKVTVTFCVDNETYISITINTGTSLNERMPSVPSKEGFDFMGWYAEDGKEFTSETKVYADITVYAKWNLNEDYVLVTYIIDNEIYMTLACKKSMITEPYIPEKSGKELNGWYTDKELQNKFSFDTVIEEDSLTLYAEWKNNSNLMILFIFLLFAGFMAAVIASTKRISFYESKDDEEKYASVIMIGKGTLNDRLPSHASDNFEGWYSESGELISEDTEITQSMNIYARWNG